MATPSSATCGVETVENGPRGPDQNLLKTDSATNHRRVKRVMRKRMGEKRREGENVPRSPSSSSAPTLRPRFVSGETYDGSDGSDIVWYPSNLLSCPTENDRVIVGPANAQRRHHTRRGCWRGMECTRTRTKSYEQRRDACLSDRGGPSPRTARPQT